MSICSKCGNQVDAKMQFCNRCGAMIIGQKKKATAATNATEVLKKLGSSPIFLAAVVAYTLSILVSIIMASGSSDIIMSVLYELVLGLQNTSVPKAEFMYAIVGVVSFIAGVFGTIPNIIMAVGLWLCFYHAKRYQGTKFNTLGLTLIRIICVTELVFLGINVLLYEVVLLAAAIVMSGSFSGASVVPVLVLSMLLLIGVFGVGIYFYIKAIKTVSGIIRTAKTGVPSGRASRFVGVYCYATAVLGLIGMVASLVAGLGYAISTVLECIMMTIYSASFGFLIFKYRKEMDSITK